MSKLEMLKKAAEQSKKHELIADALEEKSQAITSLINSHELLRTSLSYLLEHVSESNERQRRLESILMNNMKDQS